MHLYRLVIVLSVAHFFMVHWGFAQTMSSPFLQPQNQVHTMHATQPGMQPINRSEPANRIAPYILNPNEQRELDEFLARWERYSANIRQYEVDFNLFDYDPTIPGAQPNVPYRISFGNFKYNASPMRYLMVVEGEWRDNKPIKRDGDKNPHIAADKILIDDKTVYKYDYNAKTVHQIHVPPEMIGQGIADSPLPLIFGAKADELKRRFSMKVEHRPDGMTVLYARPMLIEDQQEFKELEVMLERDLRARGLKQYDINNTGWKVYELRATKINPIISNLIEHVRNLFTPDTPRGWKVEQHSWTQPSAVHQAAPSPASPQPQLGNPVPLYRGL